MPDIEPFVSPIDGRVISGRAALREHNRQHNVTNIADYTESWSKAEKEREKFFKGGGGYDRQRRIEHIKRSYEKHRK